MVAMVRRPSNSRVPRIYRIERDQPDTIGAQRIEKALCRRVRPKAVINDIDLYPLTPFRNQGACECSSDRVVGKDKRFKVDVVTRAAYGVKHRWVGRRAILEQRDSISDYQGATADRLFESEMTREDIGLSGLPLKPPDNLLALCS